ncbi:MAG: hypothetical protein ACE5R5_08555 [Nitrosarchaeum sp.]
MKVELTLFAMVAVLIVGTIGPVMAESTATWDDKSSDIKRKYEEKRHEIEKRYQLEFDKLEKQYAQVKMEIYKKIESNPNLSQSEIDLMFNQFIAEFDAKRKNLESNRMQEFKELEKSFKNEYDKIRADSKPSDSTKSDYSNTKTYQNNAPHLNDPQWKTIEPMAQKIMDSIPMEKIQSLWESGQTDTLLKLIVSETDLTYDEAKRVILFFEKYDDRRNTEKKYYDEKKYLVQNQPSTVKPYPNDGTISKPYPNDGTILKLEQRVVELEKENKELREYNSQLEKKIAEINAIVLEQIKIIYDWVIAK